MRENHKTIEASRVGGESVGEEEERGEEGEEGWGGEKGRERVNCVHCAEFTTARQQDVSRCSEEIANTSPCQKNAL